MLRTTMRGLGRRGRPSRRLGMLTLGVALVVLTGVFAGARPAAAATPAGYVAPPPSNFQVTRLSPGGAQLSWARPTTIVPYYYVLLVDGRPAASSRVGTTLASITTARRGTTASP